MNVTGKNSGIDLKCVLRWTGLKYISILNAIELQNFEI
jgi:hypothetical protein